MAKKENANKATGVENTPVKPVEDVKPVKVYKFASENKFLTVTSLGVQFVGGKASTTDLAVAKALATIDGVSLVGD